MQLFSPAFFHDKDQAFKRVQLLGYRKNPQGYLKQFVAGCFAPYPVREVEHGMHHATQLAALLEYEWQEMLLQKICNRGVGIEVYLGGKDAIINAMAAKTFFLPYATTFYIKNANHFLLEE